MAGSLAVTARGRNDMAPRDDGSGKIAVAGALVIVAMLVAGLVLVAGRG